MSEEQLIAAIDDAESRSYGSSASSLTTELATERATLISLYLGENLTPTDEGSNAGDRTVFETVQAMLPSLCRIFANGDDIVTLEPVGPQDVKQAEQETAYLNWLVQTTMSWFELFLEWATDALTAPNSYFLVYRDRKRSVEIEKYEGQTKQGLAYLLQDPNAQLIESRQYPAPDLPPEPVIDPATGQPAVQVVGVDPATGQPILQPVLAPAMLYDATIRRASDGKKLCIRVLPPERVKVDQQTYSWRVNESCNYFEYYEEVTISDLRAQGFEISDDLADEIETETPEDSARDQYGETRLDNYSVTDKSMRRVIARMIWIRADVDGDGIAELVKVLRVGRKVLYAEEVSRITVASGASCPLPHRHPGHPTALQVADVQITKTELLRQGLNNIYLSNNPQKVVGEGVNIDDALVSRPGGLIRATDINNIRHETPPFVFPQAVAGLEYLNQVAQTRAGVNAGMASIDSSNLNNIQPGTVNQLSAIASEKLVQVARILAFGIEDLFAIIHEESLKMGHKKQAIKISGDWAEVNPGAWKKRDCFKICVAFGAGNKDAQIGRLMALAQKQFEALMAGVPVVTPEEYYTTLVELTKAIDITAVDRFWRHPSKMPPKPPPPPPPEIITHALDNQTKERIKKAELEQAERESVRKMDLELYAINANTGRELVQSQIDHGHQVALEGLKTSHTAILEALHHKFEVGMETAAKTVDKAHHAISSTTSSLSGINDILNKVHEGVKHANKFATAKRQVRRNDRNEIDGIDFIDSDGNVLMSQKALKDATGRVTGMQ